MCGRWIAVHSYCPIVNSNRSGTEGSVVDMHCAYIYIYIYYTLYLLTTPELKHYYMIYFF